MNYKVILKGQEDSFYDQINIEVHYTEAISKHQFMITQGGIDTVPGRDIHLILPYLQSISYFETL